MKRFLILGLMASTVLAATPALAQRGEGRGRGEAGSANNPRPNQKNVGEGRGQGWSRSAPQERAVSAPRERIAPPQRVAPTVTQTRVPPSNAAPVEWRRQRENSVRNQGPEPGDRQQSRRWSNDRGTYTATPPVQREAQRNWNRTDGQRDNRWSQNDDARRDRNWERDNRPGNDDRWRTDRNRYESRDRNDHNRDRDWNYQRRLNERDRWADTRRWDNRWRNDHRYDWRDYRTHNRYVYRLPAYHAPYGWSYGYRRFSIGIYLNNILFGSDYWIDDPYSYRLPPAYGPLRWVRYYDDALLIDVRDGYVVDVIHDFFW